MEMFPIQGLLEEIERQLGMLHNNPQSLPSQDIGDSSVKELFHEDNEYRLALSRVKERITS
jgi:hypothetical protein